MPLRSAIPRSASLLLAFALPAPAPVPASDHALQLTGEFHGAEVVARDGEEWLALTVEGGQTLLEPVIVRVEAVHDGLLDAEGELGGRRVEAPALREEPLALLRGPSLGAGAPIASADLPTGPLQPGTATMLRAPGLPALRLELHCEAPATPSATRFPCPLRAIDRDGARTLHVFDGSRDADGRTWLGDDGGFAIRHAGDLDRDGRLDLILDVSDHYNVLHPTLFLSGDAAAGQPLRVAAILEITGC